MNRKYITNIKGKDYMTVAGRIKEFWDKASYGLQGYIETEIILNDDKQIVMKATVKMLKEGTVLSIGTGHASEIKGSSMINSTSAMENCETSAVGRALGMLGLGLIEAGGIASADEVINATKTEPKKIKFVL